MANITSPTNYNAVVTGTYYFAETNGFRRTARGLIADAAGTVTVEKIDGTTIAVPIHAGLNLFQHTRVTANAGAITLIWFE